jgi:hypothetical protein
LPLNELNFILVDINCMQNYLILYETFSQKLFSKPKFDQPLNFGLNFIAILSILADLEKIQIYQSETYQKNRRTNIFYSHLRNSVCIGNTKLIYIS